MRIIVDPMQSRAQTYMMFDDILLKYLEELPQGFQIEGSVLIEDEDEFLVDEA